MDKVLLKVLFKSKVPWFYQSQNDFSIASTVFSPGRQLPILSKCLRSHWVSASLREWERLGSWSVTAGVVFHSQPCSSPKKNGKSFSLPADPWRRWNEGMALKTTLPSFLLFYFLLSLLPSQNSNKMPDTCLGLGYMVIKQTDLVPLSGRILQWRPALFSSIFRADRNTGAANHMWLLDTWHVANVTKDLNLSFYLMLTNLNLSNWWSWGLLYWAV